MYYFSRFGLPRAPMAQILQFPVHIKIRMIMNRDNTVRALEDRERIWDVAVIGGGATGLGVAVDAATRGYSVVLFEQEDFAKGTSSRSTKLVHGGVRYLAQGDVGLVFEALRERGLLRRNAPHLVENEDFIIPCYRWWEKPFYTIGLTVYDLMAGRLGLGKSLPKKRSTVLKLIPTLKPDGLRGGVSYHDGQFDDARLAVNLAQTATDAGGMVMNYARVTGLLKGADGTVNGVRVEDRFTDRTYDVRAGAVINATGVFVDSILVMDNPEDKPMVRPSQGIHVVLDRSFLGGTSAVMIPKTATGGAVRRAVARQGDRRNDRHAARTSGTGAPSAGRRGELHPRHGRTLPDSETEAERRAVGIRRPPSARGPERGRQKHERDLAEPQNHRIAVETRHDHGRQMDDLP